MSRFKEFVRWFTLYQKYLGLNGYKAYLKTEPLADSFADITVDQDGMVATVRLNNSLSDKEKPYQDIHGSAKHEALHLLVGRLVDYARSRYISSIDIQEAEEELVRRLEQLIPSIPRVAIKRMRRLAVVKESLTT